MTVEEAVTAIVGQSTAGTSLFPVVVRHRGSKVEVVLDGDTGVTVGDCTRMARQVKRLLPDYGHEPDNFDVEVSSAGIGKPLGLPRQMKANVGRNLQVTLHEGQSLTGKLLLAGPAHLVLKQAKGKKTVTVELEKTKEAKVVI